MRHTVLPLLLVFLVAAKGQWTDSGDLPESLIDALSSKPYVEERCESATWEGWPHEAKLCRYARSRWPNLQVYVANPSPERAGHWIVDAANTIGVVRSLRMRSQAHYEKALVIMARQLMGQSSRIFPLQGDIWEDMSGNGVGKVYYFEKGVTKSCSGCYCRLASLTPASWCRYQESLGESYRTCLDRLPGSSEEWRQQCLDNHAAAWESDRNESLRAKAFIADASLQSQFPRPDQIAPADLLAAFKNAYQ